VKAPSHVGWWWMAQSFAIGVIDMAGAELMVRIISGHWFFVRFGLLP